MRITHCTFIVTYLISFGQCVMEPYIIDGLNASILQFPFSAYLYIKCVNKNGHKSIHVCGSSILNQYLTLTAAHCTSKCFEKTSIVVYVGHEVWFLGATSTAKSFLQHEYFHAVHLTNDICLVRLKTPLQFSSSVNRVALMDYPPYGEMAFVAGWGLHKIEKGSNITYKVSNKTERINSATLKYAVQIVKRGDDCPKRRNGEHPGLFCTQSTRGHAAKGDSGSALVVLNYIQVGIVSHAIKLLNDWVVFFTDTGYYYNWIIENSRRIKCACGGRTMINVYHCSLTGDESPCDEEENK